MHAVLHMKKRNWRGIPRIQAVRSGRLVFRSGLSAPLSGRARRRPPSIGAVVFVEDIAATRFLGSDVNDA
jgi:hypothetical protein